VLGETLRMPQSTGLLAAIDAHRPSPPCHQQYVTVTNWLGPQGYCCGERLNSWETRTQDSRRVNVQETTNATISQTNGRIPVASQAREIGCVKAQYALLLVPVLTPAAESRAGHRLGER
jgi:hypothetical protein